MPYSAYIIIFAVILLFLYQDGRKKQMQKIILKKIKKGQKHFMNDIIKNFIGKKCVIYTFQNQITCVVEKTEENWVFIDNNGSKEIVNIDYIARIREYPKNKKGKDKAIVTD